MGECYTVTLDRPHATKPSIIWSVTVWDLVAGGAINDLNGHSVCVPVLQTWTPDTLRLVLHELSAYIPAHEAADAQVRVEACHRRRGGRQPKVPRSPAFDHQNVKLSVEARGWRAEVVCTSQDNRPVEKGETRPFPEEFTEPMQAWLLELAPKSPFPLAIIHYEYSQEACLRSQKPSRLNLQMGYEADWDPDLGEYRNDLADEVLRLRQRLDALNNQPGGRLIADEKGGAR